MTASELVAHLIDDVASHESREELRALAAFGLAMKLRSEHVTEAGLREMVRLHPHWRNLLAIYLDAQQGDEKRGAA